MALRRGRCVAETAALAGRTARTAPGFAPASPQLAPEGPTVGTQTLDPLERRIYEVDPLAYPRCAAPMRIVAVITDQAVITRIVVRRARRAGSRRTRASGARHGERARRPAGLDRSRFAKQPARASRTL